MKIFEAIDQMRKLSKAREPFSISFMSYNATSRSSEGIVHVRHARLRSRTMEAHHLHAGHVEEYTDLDTAEPRRFYQPLLMSFNGQKVEH